MAGFKGKFICYANHKLASPTTTVCTLADTYYKVGGTWSNGSCSRFRIDGTGRLYYTGQPRPFLFNGASDLSVSAPCHVTYALYKDGVLIPGAESPRDFVASSKTGPLGITQIVEDLPACYLEVWAKCDVAGVTISHSTLMLTYWGGPR